MAHPVAAKLTASVEFNPDQTDVESLRSLLDGLILAACEDGVFETHGAVSISNFYVASPRLQILDAFTHAGDAELSVPEFLRMVADRINDDLDAWEADGCPEYPCGNFVSK